MTEIGTDTNLIFGLPMPRNAWRVFGVAMKNEAPGAEYFCVLSDDVQNRVAFASGSSEAMDEQSRRITPKSGILKFFAAGNCMLVADGNGPGGVRDRVRRAAARELVQSGAHAAIAVHIGARFHGFVAVRRSGTSAPSLEVVTKIASRFIAAGTAESDEMSRRIDERRSILTLLAHGVGHDFQNLLLPAGTMLEIVRDRVRDSERALHALALQQLDFVRGWLADADAFASFHPELGPAGTRRLIAAACRSVEHRAMAKKIAISVVGRAFKVTVDELLVRRAIESLLANAIDASSEGSQVKVSTEAGPHGSAVISIIDQGAGIPETVHDHIGRPFFSIRKGRTRETRGHGFGLAACQLIAAAHGGEMWFESTVNRGTTFHLQLPLTVGS